ncbi:MAG: protein kinase [Candidatus Obscuribacterales bacterium]
MPVEERIRASFEADDDREEIEITLNSESFPVDRYRAIARLGSGAAGEVYLCRDRLLRKKVAVKVLHELTSEQLISFQTEATATAKLVHPGIVTVLDFGPTPSGIPYMVMTYAPGLSLEAYLVKNGIVSEPIAIEILKKLANALAYAHKNGVFHRDIKPSNIILDVSESGFEVTLIDFGIAKVREASSYGTAFQSRTLAGSPPYMSPDTIRGKPFDARSDVYSLGCVMFEMFTSRPPYTGETALELVALHLDAPIPDVREANPAISDQMAALVSKCLAKEKRQRPQSMNDLKAKLEQIVTLDSNVDHSKMPLVVPRLDPSSTDGRLPKTIALAVLGLVFAGFATWIFILFGDTRIPKESANSRPKETRSAEVPTYLTESAQFPESKGPAINQKDDRWRKLIESMPANVTTVNLSFKPVQDADLKLLYSHRIRALYLGGTLISDAGLVDLASHMRSLSILRLPDTRVSDSGIKNIGLLKDLTELDLRGCNITDGGLKHLSSLKNLRVLDLSFCHLKGPGLQYLTQMSKLHTLNLRSTSIHDEYLANLSNLVSLAALDISSTPITGKTLEHLTNLPKLKAVNISSCKILPAKIESFKKKQPHTELRDYTGETVKVY